MMYDPMMYVFADPRSEPIAKVVCSDTKSDRPDAGWYVPNSVNVKDIVPKWTKPGGGVGKDDLRDLFDAFDRAIRYTKQNISRAELHLHDLIMAQNYLRGMTNNTEYKDDIPDYGDLITVEEFKANVDSGAFIDYDGFGYPAKDGKVDSSLMIPPSMVGYIPSDATHIIWFNR